MNGRCERIITAAAISSATTILILTVSKEIRLEKPEQNGDDRGCKNSRYDCVPVPAEPSTNAPVPFVERGKASARNALEEESVILNALPLDKAALLKLGRAPGVVADKDSGIVIADPLEQ